MHVRLAHASDLAGFRSAARGLLARQVAPEAVTWSEDAAQVDLFGDADAAVPPEADATPAPAIAVPAGFVRLCETVILHRDAQRFALLYRLLWRLAREPALRHDPLDPDLLQANAMARAVGHDMHKMRAFVRFRPVADGTAGEGPLHVAWFEPQHQIVEANAPWFQRRFANMRWAILTPDRCAEWDGQALHLRAGARREDAPAADAGEALWLTYYRSIFNPARLNLPQMTREMPRRYWSALPEAQLIAPLATAARERTQRMMVQPATVPTRRVVPLVPRPALEAAPGSLDALAARLAACQACPHAGHATQVVPGHGPLQPALMLVGEQPGDEEDLRGRPFVGPAGQLLDRALLQAGIARDGLYLTNAVRHFKYELRGRRRVHKTPSQQDALACRPWLEEEIALVRPGALVALGATAARSLLGRAVAVTRERGHWLTRGDGLRVLVTLHPSALLRLPDAERPAAFEAFVHDLRQAGGA